MVTSLSSVFIEVRPDTSGFSSELKTKLSKTREAIDVAASLDTKKFDAQLASLKTELRTIQLTRANIQADTTAANLRIKQLKLDIAGLDKKVKLGGDTSELTAKILAAKAEIASLGGVKAKLSIDTAQASSNIRVLKAQLQAFDSVGGGGGGGGGSKGGLLGGSASFDLGKIFSLYKVPAVVTGLSLVTGAVAALGAASVGAVAGSAPLVGVLAAYPAVALAAGQAMAVTKLSFNGFGDALKALNDPATDPKKLAEALDKLPPPMQRLAREVSAVQQGGQIDRLRNALSAEIAPGLSKALKSAVDLLPIVRREGSGTAKVLGDLAASAAQSADTPFFKGQLSRIMETNNVALKNGGTAAISLAHALFNIVDAFRPVLVSMSEYAVRGAKYLETTTRAGLETGKLGAFFERSWKLAREFGAVIRDLAVGLFNVGKASSSMSGFLGKSLTDGAKGFREFTESTKGQNSLKRFFEESIPVVREFGLLIGTVARGMARMSTDSNLVPVIKQIRTELVPAIGELASGVGKSFGPALISAATAFIKFNNALTFSPLAAVLQIMANIVIKVSDGIAGLPSPLNKVLATMLALSVGVKAAAFAGGALVNVFGPMATAINLVATAEGRATIATNLHTASTKISAAAAKTFAAVQWLVNAALTANPIGIVVVALAALAAGLIYAYKHSKTFREIVNGAFSAVKNVMGSVVNWISDTLIPFFTKKIPAAFQATVQWVKSNWGVILAILTGPIGLATRFISSHWDDITGYFKAGLRFIGGVFKTEWNGLRAIIMTPINLAKDAIQNIFGEGGPIRSAFSRAVTAIGNIWDGLKAAAKAPVNFIINTVYNNGIRKVVNALPGVPNLPELKGFSSGGYTGPGARHQVAGVVHAGEVVFDQPAVKAAGGAQALDSFRQGLKAGIAKLPGYASGGVVWPTVGRRVSTYAGHDGVDINQPPGPDFGAPIYAYRAGRVTYAGSGRGYGQAVFEKAAGFPEVVYGHMSRILTQTGALLRAGQVIGRVGATGNASGPHLHFGHPGGSYAQALALLRGAGADGSGSAGVGVSSAIGGTAYTGPSEADVSGGLNPAKWISQLKKLGGWGPMLGGFVGNIAGNVKDWALGKVKAAISAAGSFASSKLSGGVNRWSDTVRRVLDDMNEPSSLIGKVLRRMDQESGGNPAAVNRSDSNWKAGHPSVGLMQVIRGTYSAYKPNPDEGPYSYGVSMNPYSNIYAGLNYARNRYSSIAAAMDKAGGYDSGGVALGQGYMAKNVIAPERVLSPRQTASFDKLVATLERDDRRVERVMGAPLIGSAIIRETVDLERYERERAFRERRTNLGGAW